MDLYLLCLGLGAAGLAAMALFGSASSWKYPRVVCTVLVGFGVTGLIFERLVGSFPSLPIALVGGIAFERVVVRRLFRALIGVESRPIPPFDSAVTSEARAVTGFDANGNGLVSVRLGDEAVQILSELTRSEREAGVRVRAGDTLRIEEVDPAGQHCVVSRLALIAPPPAPPGSPADPDGARISES